MKRPILLIVFAVLYMFSAFKVTAQAVNTQDSLALVDLYNATSSAQPWTVHTNWLTTQPVKSWYGVTVVANRVMRLHLGNNNLTGHIPASLSNLNLLDTLVLSNNNLTDTLPQSFYNFSPVLYIDVSVNKFTFASLQQLGSTFLFSKYYGQGPIPLVTNGNVFSVSAGGTLSNNTYTWYKNNSVFTTVHGDSTLTVPVPADDDYTVSVTNNVAPNVVLNSFDTLRYSDSVALAEVYQAMQFENIYIDYKNRFETWPYVTVEKNRVVRIAVLFDPAYNNPPEYFDGSLSPAIGKLTALRSIYIAIDGSNQAKGWVLHGPLPAEIGNLKLLDTLDLSNNALDSTLPSSIGRLANLTTLNLGGNNFTGDIPDSMQYLQNLVTLNLSSSQYFIKLTGNLQFLGKLTNLQSVYLQNNNINDSLPSSIGHLLPKLTVLNLYNNSLWGTIPSSLGNDTLLQELYLGRNNLTGSIPPSLGNLKRLTSLDLGYNNLSDTLPAALGNLGSLQLLAVNNNKVTGQIPSLVKLTHLGTARFNDNRFTGNNMATVINSANRGIEVFISNNKFTFDGMAQFVKKFASDPRFYPGTVFYAPQLNQPIYRDGNKLYMRAGDIGNDTFRLFKDGTFINAHLSDSAFTITATGTYNIVATNSAVPRLTLYTDSIVVTSLPVTLLNFMAARVKTNVQLNWQTTQEINAANYFVERSINGFDFTGIGTVRATGNSTITQQYSFVDYNAAALNSNNLFYRLKIADKDGSYSYSKIINLQNEGAAGAFIVYPNPVHTSCIVQFTAATAGKYSIALVAADGKVLKRINVAATAGSNRVAINVQDLPQATYMINITGAKDNTTLKLVKE